MNGILSDMPQGVLMDPRQQMMMQTGLGLLAAGGPSLTPQSFGQSIGKAGMQGMEAFQKAQTSNQQQQLFQIKLAEAQREIEERKKKEAAMAALRADPRFAGLGGLLDVSPQAAIDRALPKQPTTPFSRLNPADYTPESLQAFQRTNDVSVLAPRARPQGPQSDLGRLDADFKAGLISQADYDAKRAKLIAPAAPLVSMPAEETAFQKKVGAQMGEQYSTLLQADMNAPVNISKYQRLGQLLSNVNTGKFKGTTLELKAAAKTLGVDLTALGVADDVAPAQAARALTNQLALEMRNPAGGAGMPGALSDKDREFLVQSIPGLENDPAAIPTMIDYRVRLAKREQHVAKMARAYRKKNGKFDEGFYDELQEWSDKNPLFPEARAPKPAPAAAPDSKGGLTPAEQKELEDLRKRLVR